MAQIIQFDINFNHERKIKYDEFLKEKHLISIIKNKALWGMGNGNKRIKQDGLK